MCISKKNAEFNLYINNASRSKTLYRYKSISSFDDLEHRYKFHIAFIPRGWPQLKLLQLHATHSPIFVTY